MNNYLKIALAFTLANRFFCDTIIDTCAYDHFDSLFLQADRQYLNLPKTPIAAPEKTDNSFQAFAPAISCTFDGGNKYVFYNRFKRFYDELPLICQYSLGGYHDIYIGTGEAVTLPLSKHPEIINIFHTYKLTDGNDGFEAYSCVPTMDISRLIENLKPGSKVSTTTGSDDIKAQNDALIRSKNRIACHVDLVYEAVCKEPEATVRFRCREATPKEKKENPKIETVFGDGRTNDKVEVCGRAGPEPQSAADAVRMVVVWGWLSLLI